ncbi:MAG: peptide-modifying radical SAM enzyme CbpB [Kiritimatiellaeota bacterium]|nr:peptide-modifying radical SAM enzyme CbpB [Kiritimatiellota bacterium]
MKDFKYFNSGRGPALQPIDIGHDDYCALIEPDTAFWSLVKKNQLGHILSDADFMDSYKVKMELFEKEMTNLRRNLKPSAVYFNPTDRCNLNCAYCYIPKEIRKNGDHMSLENLTRSLGILKDYFTTTIPEGSNRLPQIIFHGSEPMMNKDAVFAGIEKYADDFHFGIQTNATLLDDDSIDFIKEHKVGVGISIDGPTAEVGDRARVNWDGQGGAFEKAASVIEKLKDHAGFNVICTVTTENMRHLTETVEFFHEREVKVCMLNVIRCTQEHSRCIKPEDADVAGHFLSALDRAYELYEQTGRKLIVANFANILISIIAPTARRLMCDISPCGGGRCFFAVSAKGDMFPCSEFIGLPEFNGGNIFKDDIDDVLQTDPFKKVTGRDVDTFQPCSNCAIKHFCGAPCPAEAYEMNGGMDKIGAFCEFYEEQTRYAFRVIADEKVDAFLWKGWDKDTEVVYDISSLI